MGNTQAKQEEIIIVQAGNSGGQTKAKEFGSAPDILAMVTLLLLMVVLVYFITKCCKKKLDKTIRKEIYKSRDTLQV